MERIAAAACRHKGQVFHLPPPARHWNVIAHIVSECQVQEHEFPICPPPDQGFVTDTGRFVDRTEAWKIARDADQLLPTAYVTTHLFSEDVW